MDSRRRKLAILQGKAIEHLTNAAARASFLRMIDFIAGMIGSYVSEIALEMTGGSSH